MTLPFIYFGNPLIESLGPLLTETDIHKRMARTPALPTTKDIQRREVAMHQLQSVKDLYVVTPESLKIGLTVSMSIREGYRFRNPYDARTTALIRGRPLSSDVPESPINSIMAVGGMGNTWRIPLCFLTTPDGMEAMGTRFSVAQRMCLDGHHHIKFPDSAEDPDTLDFYLPALERYQYFAKPIVIGPMEREELFKLTGFVPRILFSAWRLGQRIALETDSKSFKFDHIRAAVNTYLAPLKAPISALQSNDPLRMRRYQDLLPPDGFWNGLG